MMGSAIEDFNLNLDDIAGSELAMTPACLW
jgi:hypothetical protein